MMRAVPEVGEGDQIQVRIGEPLERILNVTVKWVNVEESVGVLTLTCEITGEVPALGHRATAEGRRAAGWWP